jgi:hypothetical protein
LVCCCGWFDVYNWHEPKLDQRWDKRNFKSCVLLGCGVGG